MDPSTRDEDTFWIVLGHNARKLITGSCGAC